MCGRYTLKDKKNIKNKYDIDIVPNYNICPGLKVPVLTNESSFMNWGYCPSWAKTPMNIINARYESIKHKPMFSNMKRCVMFMDGWYEWDRHFDWDRRQNKKVPHYHHLGGELLYMAGLFIDTQCISITKPSEGLIANIHSRQPLLLDETQISMWIDGEFIITDKVSSNIQIHQVSTHVNSPKNNDEICIKPV